MAVLPQRMAGVLMPTYALRRENDLGIGDTRAMREAIDFCKAQGFRVLQTLPIHDTLVDNSPYNPISAHALSGILLTFEPEEIPGLDESILETLAPQDWVAQLREGRIKYELVRALKRKLLVAAWEKWKQSPTSSETSEFESFKTQNQFWLAPYSLFRTIASQYDHSPDWSHWKPEHRSYTSAEMWYMNSDQFTKLSQYRDFYYFVQWVAHRQWKKVRDYAEAQDILLMGEMSFGVSKSSVDVWAHPELFDLAWSMGTPPVAYFETNKDSERWGQNWGFPPYCWEAHRDQNFLWLKQRIQAEAQYFHIVRLDHMRGYFRAYMFPWQGGAEHAEFNALTEEEVYRRCGGRYPRMVPGPDQDPITAQLNEAQGREILSTIQEAVPNTILFGELMGKLPPYMERTLEDLEIPNLSFPLLETDPQGELYPMDHFRVESLIAYGNHDHAPLATVYAQTLARANSNDFKAQQQLENLLSFAKWNQPPPPQLTDELLGQLQDSLLTTPQILANFSIADVLGCELRFNLPGTYGDGTWTDRLAWSMRELEQGSFHRSKLARIQASIVASYRSKK